MYNSYVLILAPSWYAQQSLSNMCRLMCLNQSLIVTPYKTARYVSYSFPNYMLNGATLNTVDSCTCKYLGHIISLTKDDNPHIIRQVGKVCSIHLAIL